mgnify:CR=1 FL=1
MAHNERTPIVPGMNINLFVYISQIAYMPYSIL